MTNVEALKNLYISCGGQLTDKYDDIANGIPVSDYVITPDLINAISQKMAIAMLALKAIIDGNH